MEEEEEGYAEEKAELDDNPEPWVVAPPCTPLELPPKDTWEAGRGLVVEARGPEGFVTGPGYVVPVPVEELLYR